ncbi:MAG: tetratricopeptide repeat protein [Brevundimonas sp.]
MLRVLIALTVAWVMLAGRPASAQDVERAPVPAWVLPVPPLTQTAPAGDAPIRMLAIDEQVRFDAEGVHTYYFRRMQVLNRQGLPLVSTVSAVWTPPRHTIQVHAVRIVRGDQVIDVLADQTFQTLRRENNLESSMLDGKLTATLQPRDLRVGDILEYAFTIHDDGGVLAPHRESLSSLRSGSTVDYYRMRATWPADQMMQAAAATPWADVQPRLVGQTWTFEVEARDLAPERIPTDLPGRYQLTRIIQITDMADWGAASILMAPLYARAATLDAGSPLAAEIERIRAAHDTDADRAAAALRLVQDEVRYLSLSMGEGGYVPMSADDVWRYRYGDCKGKTVLLLALLHGLGIEAEAAMASINNGDGMPDRLPLVGWFDHVLVRATINGRTYWMDGARVGDRSLAALTPPPYRWALPVRAAGAQMERIVQPPATVPTFETLVETDATAGLDAPATSLVDITYHGNDAILVRQQVGAIPPDQLQTMMTASMSDADGGVQLESFDTRYDDDLNTFHLILRGTLRQGWVNSTGGRMLAIPEAAISIPYQAEREGVFAPFADAPFALGHPYLNRTTMRIRLPGNGEGFQLEGGDQTVEAGGYRMERRATLRDGVAEIVLTTTSLASELSAADMADARTRAESLVNTTLRLRAPAGYVATPADLARLEPGNDAVADLVKRAQSLWDSGDTVAALALLDAAVVQDPDNAEARRTRGGVHFESNDYEAARADFDHAVDLDPADAEAMFGQGRVAMATGRFADAIVSFSVALRLNPGDAGALSARGASYHQIGRWDRSLADYRAVKTLQPSSDVGLLGELRALTRLDRTDEARTIIKAKLESAPENSVALQALVALGKRDGQFAETLEALDAGLVASPDDFGLMSLRGEVRALAGDADGARADFSAMRRMASGNPQLMNGVCWNQATSGFDLDQALADCDVAVVSGEAGIIDSRAMVLLQMERYAEARATYDQALAASPDLSASLYGRGMARLMLGDAAGREDLERARALNVDVGEDFAVFEARHPGLGG